jgi:hypothetical protein
VTVVTPGTGCSITSTGTLSTEATGRAAFFTRARFGLALATARFAATFPRSAFESFLALGRAFAPFLFWTFDDCFLRFAIIDPWFTAESQKTTDAESRQPTLRVINR